MLLKIKTAKIILLATGVFIGGCITANLGYQAQAKEAEQAVSATEAMANEPRGRKPVAIVDGQYPASYFPNTELIGADEMRIIALGTGMPNQGCRIHFISR